MSSMKAVLNKIDRAFVEILGGLPAGHDVCEFAGFVLEYEHQVEPSTVVKYFEHKWGRSTTLEEIREVYQFQQAVAHEKTLVQTKVDGN